MNIRKVPANEKKEITKALEAMIKKFTFVKTKLVINHYFKNSTEKQKALARIEELRKEINQLEKKK